MSAKTRIVGAALASVAFFAGSTGEARAAEPESATFALVVGVNTSLDRDVAPLKYADDDAARFFDLFRLLGARTTVLARLDDNTKRLHPQAAAEAREPKRPELDAAFTQLADDVARANARGVETTVYVTYAGHGSVDQGRGYVTLEDTRLTGADLAKALAKVPAKRIHLVVDACSSYFLAYARGAGGKRRAVRAFAADAELAADPRIGLVLSTSSARESHEWDAFQAGVFSHEVRSGLYGAADADGDGRVTYRELAAFVARANVSIPNEKFRPEVHTRAPGGADALVDLRAAGGRRLTIDGAHAGHYYLEDARGVRLADVHNTRGTDLYLVRPAPTGHAYLRRTSDDRELILPPGDDAVSVAALAEGAPRVASRGAAHEAFSSLFSLSFDASVVASYTEAPLPPPEADEPPRAQSSNTRRALGIGTFALGAILSGTGVGFGVSARSASVPAGASQLDVVGANNRIARDNALSAVFLGAGVTALVGGALLYLWPSTTSPRAVSIGVAPGQRGGFVVAGARF